MNGFVFMFLFFAFVFCFWCCEIEWVWVGVGLKSLDAAVHRSLPEIVVKKADQESVDKPLHPAFTPSLLFSLSEFSVCFMFCSVFFLMIGVVCMIMDPFGCWESVGKQLKLRNLLNYIMKWDGLLHDSGFPSFFLWFLGKQIDHVHK